MRNCNAVRGEERDFCWCLHVSYCRDVVDIVIVVCHGGGGGGDGEAEAEATEAASAKDEQRAIVGDEATVLVAAGDVCDAVPE